MHISRKRLTIAGSILLALLVYFTYDAWFLYCNDSYIMSDLVEVTPQVAGTISHIYVKDNEFVHKNQLLIEIDQTPFKLEVEKQRVLLNQAKQEYLLLTTKKNEASAALEVAKANLDLANLQLKRYQYLIQRRVVSQQFYDEAQTKQKISTSQTLQANEKIKHAEEELALQREKIKNVENQLRLAEQTLSYTQIYASMDGYINNLNIYLGSYATHGKPLFGLVSNHAWRVIANYQSNMISHIHPGNYVLIYISGYTGHLFIGKVESIGHAVARESGSNNPALPYVKPITDWIRYPYRYPVRIIFLSPPHIQLRMGTDVRTFVL